MIGRTNIEMSGVATFQSIFGLPPNLPELVLVPGSTDPGVVADNLGEADLDIEYSSGIAYDAQVLFVYSNSVGTSLIHAIDADVANVITYSFGLCEQDATSAETAAYQTLGGRQTRKASHGWHLPAIPERRPAMRVPPRLPTAPPYKSNHRFLRLRAWAARCSAIIAATGAPKTTATVPRRFPTFQRRFGMRLLTPTRPNCRRPAGATVLFTPVPLGRFGPGIPAGTQRGIPDLSLTAGADDDPYALFTNGGPDHVGGTSAGTPSFAGMIVLLNQYLGTNGLGNINPNLYFMAQNTSGVFHDVTTGWNGVPCVPGSPDCGSSGAFGYNAGPGWDAATGLGSVDANQMFTQWNTGGGAPQITGVVNGASLTDTGLSPGLIFTVFGAALGPATPLFLEVDPSTNTIYNNTDYISVFVNGTPAPLLYMGQNQINAVAPYELASVIGQSVVVQVNDNGINSNAFNVNVVAAAPAIFSLGNGQGAILNQDGTVNGPSNPAAPGSIVSIYATGEGQINPAGVDGQIANESLANLPRPAANFSLTIGGVSATYTYAGTAPQTFDGFFQVNAQIPKSVGSGNQPAILNLGGATSPPLNVVVE